ncbi:MAG: tRNA-dihydrouridine synthase family protein [Planctomycetes bacterium]|nr:tRNA-dihydrouridine synthase family protein [Planctomycetota bacterium]MCP4839221.1 tRNA-dihydrouridine synthase family protein [Planctomycetota bacterium]
MSTHTPSADRPSATCPPNLANWAAHIQVDARIPATVPGFDAPFFQAGLAGYSDAAMRLVARRHGCPYAVTEALLDRTLISGGKGRTREDPNILREECGLGDPSENRLAGLEDHPVAGQVMGTDPDEMGRAAEILVELGHDVVDVNLACPVKKIARKKRGGHFLTAPSEALDVLRAVRKSVPSHVPCTLKLRRAWDDSAEMARNFDCIFDGAYELGYAWATVHCRTVRQKYVGPSHWPFLADLTKRFDDRIVFGSGDIFAVADIFRMLQETGVHAVSVARGCIGNPWIFRQARQIMSGSPPQAPSLDEQRSALLDHFRLCMALHGEGGASRMMRKFGIRFSVHHDQADAVRKDFIAVKSKGDWQKVMDRWYQSQ